jgi:hypothetical protein
MTGRQSSNNRIIFKTYAYLPFVLLPVMMLPLWSRKPTLIAEPEMGTFAFEPNEAVFITYTLIILCKNKTRAIYLLNFIQNTCITIEVFAQSNASSSRLHKSGMVIFDLSPV